MAENQIDKLSLSINVKDNDSAKKILQVSNAIRNLTNSLKGLDKVSAQIKSLQSVFAGVGAISGKARRVGSAKDVLQKGTIAEQNAQTGNLPNISNATKSQSKELARIAEQTKRVGESSKKTTGFFNSFVKSIGRIALYRAIRTALKEITQAFTEGIQNYARYNKDTNQAMSNIMNSTNQLKNTLGVTLGSIMQSLAPVLENLAGMATDLFNNINMALASMQGKNTYSKAIKQNEDYAKSLDKVNGKLLSFDTFNTLATDNGSKGLFTEEAVPDELTDTAKIMKDLVDIIKTIGEAVIEIVKDVTPLIKTLLPILRNIISLVAKTIRQILPLIIQLVKPIFELLQPIVKLVSLIIDIFMPVLEQIIDIVTDLVEAIVPTIKAIIYAITGIIKFATGDWEGAIDAFKEYFINAWKGIANFVASIVNWISNAFISFVNKIIDAINFLLKPINAIGRLFGAGENFAQIGHWNASVNWTPYANGGGFTKGNAFIAGEKGTELIASTNNGGAVMNMEQLQSAIYNGMILAMAQDGGKEIVLKVDNNTLGKVVANSAGFISETNRRNASLRLV